MKTMCFVVTHALGHMMYGRSVHHVPKCMCCHKAIVRFEHSVCRGSLMTTVINTTRRNDI